MRKEVYNSQGAQCCSNTPHYHQVEPSAPQEEVSPFLLPCECSTYAKNNGCVYVLVTYNNI